MLQKLFTLRKIKFYNYISLRAGNYFLSAGQRALGARLLTNRVLQRHFALKQKILFYSAARSCWLLEFSRQTGNFCLLGGNFPGLLSNQLAVQQLLFNENDFCVPFFRTPEVLFFFNFEKSNQLCKEATKMKFITAGSADWINSFTYLHGGGSDTSYNFWFSYLFFNAKFSLLKNVFLRTFWINKKKNRQNFRLPYMVWFRKKRRLNFFRKIVAKKKKLFYKTNGLLFKQLFYKRLLVDKKKTCAFFKRTPSASRGVICRRLRLFFKKKYNVRFFFFRYKSQSKTNPYSLFQYRRLVSKRYWKLPKKNEALVGGSAQKKSPLLQQSLVGFPVSLKACSFVF